MFLHLLVGDDWDPKQCSSLSGTVTEITEADLKLPLEDLVQRLLMPMGAHIQELRREKTDARIQ